MSAAALTAPSARARGDLNKTLPPGDCGTNSARPGQRKSQPQIRILFRPAIRNLLLLPALDPGSFPHGDGLVCCGYCFLFPVHVPSPSSPNEAVPFMLFPSIFPV